MRTNKIIFVIILAISVVFSSITYADEFIKFDFDGRDWDLDYQAQEGSSMIYEWVPRGQSVENWNELVTVQAFGGIQAVMSADKFMETMRDGMSKICPGIEWNILSNRRSDVLYDWQIEYCTGHDPQYEVARILVGREAIYVIHYATKHIPIESAVKQRWITILKAVTLTDRFPTD